MMQQFKYVICCKFMKGASAYEQLNMGMNVLSITSLILKTFYDIVA